MKNNKKTSVLYFGFESGSIELVKHLISLKRFDIACKTDSLPSIDFLVHLKDIDVTAKKVEGIKNLLF